MTPDHEFNVDPCPFVVDETPYCLWLDNRQQLNIDFLNTVDSYYFKQVADTFAPLLDTDSKQCAATALRIAYSHGLETLFALIGASVQANSCPIGWLLKYSNNELFSLMRKINNGEAIMSRFEDEAVTWDVIAQSMFYCSTVDPVAYAARWPAFAKIWQDYSEEFVSKEFSDEYNSVKHGFRVQMGGFKVAIGKTPEDMLLVGESQFGNSFFVTEKLQNRENFNIVRRWHNWNPMKFVYRLHMISLSIGNVVSSLKCNLGVPAAELEYHELLNLSEFIEAENQTLDATQVVYDPGFTAADIPVLSKADILAWYKRDSAGGLETP